MVHADDTSQPTASDALNAPDSAASAAPLDSQAIKQLVHQITTSFASCPGMDHINATFLPSRAKTISIIELLRRIIFPGYFDEQRLNSQTVGVHLTQLIEQTQTKLFEQINHNLRYCKNISSTNQAGDDCGDCDEQARQLTRDFLQKLPGLRHMLATDVQAAFDGDPAAVNTDETVFCYPGLDAIFMYRIAHEIFKLGLPLLARIISEYAHNETGIDIHPGAAIGQSFFIDHGTGIVIGETTTIGKNVKLYQGVTLGALSTKGGQAWRGRKRHPTLEDDVTIYAGAVILGGQTVIGQGSTIGGSVFITRSVPANHNVSMKFPELTVKEKRQRKRKETEQEDNFQI